MSEHYDFHYQPTGSGAISGQQVLEQTEDAINELGDYVNDNVGGAMDVAQQALETAQTAETNAQTALDTANSFSSAIQSAQQDASTALSTAQTAQNTASNANNTAIQASQDASSAVTTANNASGQVSTLSGTVTTLGQRVTTAEGNIGQNTSDIIALTTRVGTAEGNITTLQNDVSIAQGNASSAMATAGTVKQQAYVFRYSSTALVDSSTNSNALLDNTDNLKIGDKVIDSSGVLFSITAIDTANSTFTVGSALIDLALDSDVVHKSGDETITDNKTFGNGTLIVNNSTGLNVHGEIKFNGSRPGYIVADNSNDGVFNNNNCGVSILLQDENKPLHIAGYKVDSNGRVFADIANKKPVLSLTSSLIKTATLVPENDTSNCLFRILSQLDYANGNPSKTLDVRFVQYDNADASSAIYSNTDNKTSLGTTSNRWSRVYATNYYYGNDNVEFSTKFVTTDTAQTVSGNKTFSEDVVINNSDTSQSSKRSKRLVIKSSKVNLGDSNSDTWGISFNAGSSYVAMIDSEKSYYSRQGLRFFVRVRDGDNNIISAGYKLRVYTDGSAYLSPSETDYISLGSNSEKWKDTCTNLINGVEPSSLSLPSDRSARIDISSYFIYLGNNTTNNYSVLANGYIFLKLNNINQITCYSVDSSSITNYAQTYIRPSDGVLYITFPVRKNDIFRTIWNTGSSVSIESAYFIPCQGNV